MIKCLFTAAIAFFGMHANVNPKLALYRYNRDASKTHYFTTNKYELGEGKNGYTFEGIACYINSKQTRYTVPFYRYAGENDYVYTSSFRKDIIENKRSFHLQKRVGFIYAKKHVGTVPLYKYYSPSLERHFYTINYLEIGKRDAYYELEGIAGYVFASRQ